MALRLVSKGVALTCRQVYLWGCICLSWSYVCLNATVFIKGFPGGTSGTELACQCRTYKRGGFDPWIGATPWRRVWECTPVFLPGESPWTEESGGLQSMGSQKVGLSIPLISCQVVGLLILRTFSGPLILPQVVFWLVLPWLAIVQIHRLELMEGYNSSQDSWLESWLQEMWDRKAS